ncbi:MAG: molybdenum cofactor guanylyltransferase [bacterium]
MTGYKNIILENKYTAVILEGGKSSRMGTVKALLPINNKPAVENIINILISHFEELLISANQNQQNIFEYLEKSVIKDEVDNQGPLGGIYSALKQSSSEKNFIIACDIPVINIELIKKMLKLSADQDYDIVIPCNNGKYEPLYAVYSKQIIPVIKELLNANSRKIICLLPLCKTKVINISMDSWYKNLNTKYDYEKFLQEAG